MMMWHVTLFFLKILYLENLTDGIQNILGPYRQWINEQKHQNIIFEWSLPLMTPMLFPPHLTIASVQ